MGGGEMKAWGIILGGMLLLTLILPLPLGAAEYSLDDLFRIALARSERIKSAEESLMIAEIGKQKAVSVLFPRLSAFGSYTRFSEDKYNDLNMLIQPESAGSWGLRADQSFSLGLREFTALGMSKTNIAKYRMDLESVQEEYLLLVARAYYDVLRVGKQLDIAAANLKRLADYRNAAEKRFKVGEATKTVLLRAEGELSGARSDLVTAENSLKLVRALLARLVGIEEECSLREAPPEEREIPSLAALKDTAFAERSDLKGLEYVKKMAAQQRSYAWGAYWPSLSLSGVYAKADQDPTSLTLNKESTYLNLALNFPLFQGGFRKADVDEATAKERQAAFLYEDLKKTIGIEVEIAYLELSNAKEVIKFQEDQLSFARENYRAVSRQFEVGLANSIDVMDANTLLVSAQRRLADAYYAYQISILKVKRATGTLLKEIMATSTGSGGSGEILPARSALDIAGKERGE